MVTIIFPIESNYLDESQSRSGCVALIGATNAGKSTLINRFVGAKVSIVTHKVQTTRWVVRGIISNKNSQIVFLDTPGIFLANDSYHKLMVKSSWNTVNFADIVLLIVDSNRGFKPDIYDIFKEIKKRSNRLVLVLNKIDCVQPEHLLKQAKIANEFLSIERTFMISATKGHGCDDVLNYLYSALPFGPWIYPEDQISDLPMSRFAAEITREKLFLHLHKEIPYASYVATEKWEERKDGSVLIRQIIYVERVNQKKIILGKNGQIIKIISSESRQEIAKIIEKTVHIFIFVKVQKDWGNNMRSLSQIGIEL